MKFALLGDLHYGTFANPEHAAACERVFETMFGQVAAHQSDMVIAIGDTTNLGTLEELRGEDAVAIRTGLNLFRVTGNHDANELDKAELAPFFLGGQPSLSDSELYTSFDLGLARFVVLDTARSKLSNTDWSGFVSAEQLAWLAGEIESFNTSDLQYLIVMGHHPIVNTTFRSADPMLNIANSDEVREIFGKLEGKTGLYICGHNHSNSIFGPDAQGWYFVQTGAPLDSECYRLITVDEDGIKIELLDFDFSAPGHYAELEMVRSNMEHYAPHPHAEIYGQENDHKLFIKAAVLR